MVYVIYTNQLDFVLLNYSGLIQPITMGYSLTNFIFLQRFFFSFDIPDIILKVLSTSKSFFLLLPFHEMKLTLIIIARIVQLIAEIHIVDSKNIYFSAALLDNDECREDKYLPY